MSLSRAGRCISQDIEETAVDNTSFIMTRSLALSIIACEQHAITPEDGTFTCNANGSHITMSITDLPSQIRNFYYDNIVVSEEKAVDLCLETLTQKGPLWKEERMKRITGNYLLLFNGK